ncbi:hypothetical protein SUGI_1108990 [Cryptomeria japonica]|nr:hypothetical protein SUGI_1108990 [Cryptomeria japonica]
MGHGKKKKSGKKKRKSIDHSAATKYLQEWFYKTDSEEAINNDFVPKSLKCTEAPVIFELHSHSTCSDGYLSPSAVVDRAHRNGVRVLALTDHDTMAGVPAALEAARKYGIRVIPGVEISAIVPPRTDSGKGEPVHILAYYGSCGPANFSEIEECLANIREGRYHRAETMLLKLKALKMPLKWEHVARIAGDGVAPGRLHVARAMVEARYVDNIKKAFSKYLYDDGPAYAMGSEILAETAIKIICRTGGVAALAHPWALKNPVSVVRSLKEAGLHGIEVYRSDGKSAGFSELADAYGLLKIGGSDFHGRGGPDETDLGKVPIPDSAMHEFLKVWTLEYDRWLRFNAVIQMPCRVNSSADDLNPGIPGVTGGLSNAQ